MKDRIKALRNSLGLTQSEFGARIGVGSSTIATYEAGREPLNPIIISICREFNVNEQWLRTGDGDMFLQNPSDPLFALLQSGRITAEEHVLLSKLLALPSESRRGIIEFMLDVSDGIKSLDGVVSSHDPDPPSLDPGPGQEWTDEALHAELDAQLSLEKKPPGESAAS